MPEPVEIKAMILVKAAPVLTSELQESMCVAAMRLGSQPEWIRLHPVPFRDLADDTKFRKYQEVTVQAIRPHSDRRPESWTPIEGSIQLGGNAPNRPRVVNPASTDRQSRRTDHV